MPYCLAAGCLLALACGMGICGGTLHDAAGRVYVADGVGSIVGGAAVSLILVWLLDSFALVACAGFLNLAAAGGAAWRWRRNWLSLASLASGVVLFLAGFEFQTDLATTALQYPGQEILFRGNSPYGRLVVTRDGRQINFFQNGLPVASTHNVMEIEEAVHYAMAQRPDARDVLLIGGGVAGAAHELLKYPAKVTCVELDPLFLELGRRFVPEDLSDSRVLVAVTDGRRFVQSNNAAFDVIIVDLADPATAQLNRFYTAEFLSEARRALKTNGVIALALGRYEDFISPELGRVLATAHRTLQTAFTHILMLPAGRVFFLASDGPLDLDIAGRIERARVTTQFVNRHYLEAMLTADRMADLQRCVAKDAAVNRDFNPVLYFDCVRLWARQFAPRFGALGVIAALAFGAYAAWLRGPALALFASGFAASSLEVALLLAFQALCGSLYYQLGIIVTVFMGGLAAGAAWANHLQAKSPIAILACLAAIIAAFSLLLPVVLALLSRATESSVSVLATQVGLALLTFALAAPVGAQFPIANRCFLDGADLCASRLYTADFMGASLGALLAATLLLPLLGMTKVCLLTAAMNALAAGTLIWRKALT
jgi:spermidine synthase